MLKISERMSWLINNVSHKLRLLIFFFIDDNLESEEVMVWTERTGE